MQPIDSLYINSLQQKLKEYIAALESQPVDIKIKECDFLINTCKSDTVRNIIVSRLYSYYLQSKIMGDESVAVHIVDNWIAQGRAKLGSPIETMNARIFADFNRRSLIGCRAPSLRLETWEGAKVDALGLLSAEDGIADSAFAGSSDRLRVLYFYDTNCSLCKLESCRLKNFLDSTAYKLEVLLIYTGDDYEAWNKYRITNFDIRASEVIIHHYWDPGLESDFQRKYGILQTPGMFLIDKNGYIAGRRLDTASLQKLVAVYSESYVYGSEESVLLFDKIFSGISHPSVEDVVGVAKYIDSELFNLNHNDVFKKMSGDLMYYLAGKKEAAYKEGERYVVDSLILSKPFVWNTREDTLNVLGMARILSQMLSRADVGTVVPDVKVYGRLQRGSRSKERVWRLRRLRGDTYIVFYTGGCSDCKAELYAADSLAKSRGLGFLPSCGGVSGSSFVPSFERDSMIVGKSCSSRISVLYVNMDEIMSKDNKMAFRLLDAFDLSSLPYITYIDKRGIVRGKYLSFIK
ncbi:MAG: peroxiredoxin family protein [Candidatus Cryptobacteroides sp.]